MWMRRALFALMAVACAVSACSPKSSLYLQPGGKAAAQAPAKTPGPAADGRDSGGGAPAYRRCAGAREALDCAESGGAPRRVAAPEGLEPPTLALGKPCSIRLSYGAAWGDRCHAPSGNPSLPSRPAETRSATSL